MRVSLFALALLAIAFSPSPEGQIMGLPPSAFPEPLMVAAGAAGPDRAAGAYNGTIFGLRLLAYHFTDNHTEKGELCDL